MGKQEEAAEEVSFTEEAVQTSEELFTTIREQAGSVNQDWDRPQPHPHSAGGNPNSLSMLALFINHTH